MGEPGGKERAEAWKTAIGLQAVDGLKTSENLNETAAKHIEGEITIEEVKELIDTYIINQRPQEHQKMMKKRRQTRLLQTLLKL